MSDVSPEKQASAQPLTQPAPKPGREDVTETLIAYLRQRQAIGRERYGTSLQTFNGRDAHADELEELLDALQYRMQARMERRRLDDDVELLRKENETLRRLRKRDAGTNRVLWDVVAERVRQDAKFGTDRDFPDGTHAVFKAAAEAKQAATDSATREGRVEWRHILDEEVTEAFAETDPQKLRAELVQVAAVAACWVEALDRRERQRGAPPEGEDAP